MHSVHLLPSTVMLPKGDPAAGKASALGREVSSMAITGDWAIRWSMTSSRLLRFSACTACRAATAGPAGRLAVLRLRAQRRCKSASKEVAVLASMSWKCTPV